MSGWAGAAPQHCTGGTSPLTRFYASILAYGMLGLRSGRALRHKSACCSGKPDGCNWRYKITIHVPVAGRDGTFMIPVSSPGSKLTPHNSKGCTQARPGM